MCPVSTWLAWNLELPNTLSPILIMINDAEGKILYLHNFLKPPKANSSAQPVVTQKKARKNVVSCKFFFLLKPLKANSPFQPEVTQLTQEKARDNVVRFDSGELKICLPWPLAWSPDVFLQRGDLHDFFMFSFCWKETLTQKTQASRYQCFSTSGATAPCECLHLGYQSFFMLWLSQLHNVCDSIKYTCWYKEMTHFWYFAQIISSIPSLPLTNHLRCLHSTNTGSP